MPHIDLETLTQQELAERVARVEHRLHELWLRQKHPKDFPTHDVHGMDRIELKDKEAELATLQAEMKRRQR